jgi:Effector Associated Constant Component 1
MDIEITVTGPDLSEKRIADSTASLLKDLRVNVEADAKLMVHEGRADDKGADVSFSQIALALVSAGAVSKLITSLFAFLSINRKFRLKVKKANGETLDLSLDHLDRNGSAKAMEMVQAFLAR